MAMTNQQQTDAYQFFVIAFGATPGVEYMSQLDEAYSFGLTTKEIVNIYTTKPAFTAKYPTFFTNEQFANALIANVVSNSASDAAKAEAKADIIAALNAGLSRGDIIFNIFTNLAAKDPSDAMWGNTSVMLANKVEVARYATEELLINDADTGVLANVNSSPASVTTAKAVLDGTAGLAVQPLTVGLDNLSGDAGNNIFNAGVVQNANGEQTNQLATGDAINGGAGTDTLNAKVQAASALNNGPSSVITPETVDVEVVNFTALAASGNSGTVTINAAFMNGLDKVGSIQSNVDLRIEDLNTLTDSGVYAERRNTKDMTIRFDHGSNDSTNGAADLVALFDNDYLLSDSSSTSSLELRMVNNLTLKVESKPLINVDALSFAVNGVDVIVEITEATQQLTGTAAYAAVAVAINAQLATQGITGVVATLLPERTTVFSDDLGGFLQGDVAGTYSPILVTSTGGALSKGKVLIDNTTTDFNGLNTQTTQSSTAENPIEVGVELLKVGRGGEGGELVIGGMATDLNNNWDYTDNALEEGVQVFNVLMDGDRTQFSSLAGLYSTNNTLDTVNVTWAADSRADLIIGNQNTIDNRSVTADVAPNSAASSVVDGFNSVTTVYNNALKDVRVFNAANNGVTAAVGSAAAVSTDVTLWAHLSDEVVAKYMDRTDIAAPAADNANFVYTFGAGNDTLNLNISEANLAASGTSGREDFTMAVNSGAGNDTVVVQIGDGQATSTTPWYVNTTIQDNLSIATGAGNDTVHANGAGAWIINTGEGNDAIYSDNSGRQVITGNNAAVVESNAVWVFNTANQAQGGVQNLFDLTSAAAVASVDKVANLDLTVSFRGINVTVQVGDTHSSTGGTVNDLVINQAIKNAINNDVYLSKLLSAQDGPGRTLIVTSKTDGVFSDADISVSVANPTAISVAQAGAGAAYLSPAQLTALGLTGGSAVAGGRFDSAIAEDAAATVETAVVTWTAFAGAGTQTIGGMTITATGAFTAAQVATVAAGGTVAGLTITTAPTAWTVGAAVGATNVFTSTSPGNVANVDLVAPAATGVGNTAPAAVTTNGAGSSIVGAVSAQPNENVINAGLGNDVVVLSTSAFAKETVNVAAAGGTAATDSDVVFNASAGATITVDAFDTVITSAGVKIFGGVGTVNVLANIIEGSAGNDTINASAATVGQGIDGKAGNDVIVGSAFADTITGGLGGDKMNGGAGADKFVIGNTDSGLVIASADEITGFVSGSDTLSLGFVGDATAVTGNYVEAGAAVADFTAALTAANAALATLAGTSAATELYAVQWDASNGYLFNDTDGNGTADQVIVLVGITGATFAAADIVA